MASALLFIPLLASLFIWMFRSKLPAPFSGYIAAFSILVTFFLSVLLFFQVNQYGAYTLTLFDWINSGGFVVSFSFLFDSLSVLMLLMISGIGSLIHFYAVGYMKEDERFNHFFAYLTLFVFFMLILVLSDNYLGMLIGWEGVGLCSYLLIGFWYENHAYNNAAKKAFLMNRIGDVGFILGILTMLVTFGSVSFATVFSKADLLLPGIPAVSCIAFFLLVGAIGKSAQFPLYTWLPDAMAGPTPVSALIHAATMVTAGIYMISRSHVLYTLSPLILKLVLIVGIFTAVIGGISAVVQSDIKKILAYSTVSQLGMMVIGLGLGEFHIALFHMLMHAFFKALLFLNAGTIIHALNGEQNAFKMGGLKRILPVTFWTTLIGMLAIIGCPPFSGAFSKEALLLAALEHNIFVFWILIGVSILTAFYMFRFFHLVFFGASRHNHHFHFPTMVMQWPVVILAGLSIFGGFLNLPDLFHGSRFFDHYLSTTLPIFFTTLHSSKEVLIEWVLLLLTPLVLFLLWLLTQQFYATKHPVEGRTIPLVLDKIYMLFVVRPYLFFSSRVLKFLEIKCVDGSILLISGVVDGSSKLLQRFQTGKIGLYLLMIVMCIIGLILYSVGWL